MSRIPLMLSLALLSSSPPTDAPNTLARQWIVVLPPTYRNALEPLCARRKAQGFHVSIITTNDVLTAKELRAGDGNKLRDRVNKLCREFKGTSYVLLAGTVGRGPGDDEKNVVPALKGTVNRMKNEPTDLGYGCPDGGWLPTVAVGRFPTRTAEEAASMVRKTINQENDPLPGQWRRRLTVLAGIPAYNPFVDHLVESLALAHLDQINPAWTGRAIYSNAASRFCPPRDDVHSKALHYVQEGQTLILYLGHSSASGFAFFGSGDWKRLNIEHGAGIFATFGCYGCQLNGREGGYGVVAMRNPHGPVAVLGSHGVCYPAMVKLAAEGFIGSLLTSTTPPDRLGSCWLALMNGLAKGEIDSFVFGLLNQVEGDPISPLATQRHEHLEMFVLLGDPALQIPTLPTDVMLKSPSSVKPDTTLTIEGTLPARLAKTRVRVTLERTPGSVPTDLEPLPKEPGPERDRVMQANHDRANRFVLSETEVEAKDKAFTAKLKVPAKLPGTQLILRAYASTDRTEGQGVLRLESVR